MRGVGRSRGLGRVKSWEVLRVGRSRELGGVESWRVGRCGQQGKV